MAVNDGNWVEGTRTPWSLLEETENGEAVIEGALGTYATYDNPRGRRVVCTVFLHDAENSEDYQRVQIDARRIVAAVNFTAAVPLELLEAMAEEPMEFSRDE